MADPQVESLQDVMQSLRKQMTADRTMPDGTVRTLPAPGDLILDAMVECVAALAERLERTEAGLAALRASADTAALAQAVG